MSGYLQGRQLHPDQHLTNIALGYRPSGMIADMIFPVVPVAKKTDSFIVWEQADLFRQQDTKRSPDTEANRVEYRVSSLSFVCANYALKDGLAIENEVNADPAFNALLGDAGRVMRLEDALMLDWDIRVAAQVTNTSNVGSSAVTASAWTDYSNSDPLADIHVAINNVQDATGYRANRIVFSNTAWRHFRQNTKVIDSIINPNVTGGGGYPSREGARDLLEMDQLLVGAGYKNSAEEGHAQSLASIWGDEVLVYYAPMLPSIEVPSFGYSFRWVAPQIPNMTVVRHPFDAKRQSQEIEIGYHQDEKITSAPLSFLIRDVEASA